MAWKCKCVVKPSQREEGEEEEEEEEEEQGKRCVMYRSSRVYTVHTSNCARGLNDGDRLY